MDRQTKDHKIRPDDRQCQIQALFHVYEDEIFLGKRLFENGSLSIGSGRKADILLNHQSVEEIHAVVNMVGSRLVLNNHFPNNGLRVNGLAVERVPLKSRDIIKIGPYDIHVEIEASTGHLAVAEEVETPRASGTKKEKRKTAAKSITSEPGANCCLVLVDRYASKNARVQAAKNLSRLYKNDHHAWIPLLSRDRFILKENLAPHKAERLLTKFHSAGICCILEKGGKPYAPLPKAEPVTLDFSDILTQSPAASNEVAPTTNTSVDQSPGEGIQTAFGLEPDVEKESVQVPAKTMGTTVPEPLFRFCPDEELDEDDEEEALWVTPFSLKDRLQETAPAAKIPKHLPRQLSIIKNIGQEVADVVHLGNGKSYRIPGEKGAQLFARQTAKGLAQVYFTKAMGGYIKYADQATVDLDQYKQDTHLHSRRKQIYRFSVPDDAVVVIRDGEITFTLNQCAIGQLPDIKEDILPKAMTWRHWAASFGFHLILIIAAAILYYFQATAPLDEQPRFVKIDPSLLKQLELRKAKIEKPEPKEIPPPPKPEPQKVAEKVEPAKKKAKPEPAPKTTAAKKTRKTVAKAAQPSKHPKAGGGYGKGNTTNRNINQTGLLSLLGNSTIAGPSEAIASVTNLDAVPSPGATQKNYTVGGIKGSLGTGKIAVNNDAIIQTKGSTQVLRSAGASGPGQVAALEKGKTGKKQVQAMVTAKMTRTVKIDGGMSREAVKRVIDQHLDEITMCYETALLSNPSISGRVVFEWKILMSGRVGEIKIVASNINSNEIHECIKASIKGWQFPKPSGAEVVVSYPFVFDLVAF